jgi:hypothetical protein
MGSGWHTHPALLQRLVDLQLGKGGVSTEHHFFVQLLLPLNLWQQHLFPAAQRIFFLGILVGPSRAPGA